MNQQNDNQPNLQTVGGITRLLSIQKYVEGGLMTMVTMLLLTQNNKKYVQCMWKALVNIGGNTAICTIASVYYNSILRNFTGSSQIQYMSLRPGTEWRIACMSRLQIAYFLYVTFASGVFLVCHVCDLRISCMSSLRVAYFLYVTLASSSVL